jgi:hypothetical protein
METGKIGRVFECEPAWLRIDGGTVRDHAFKERNGFRLVAVECEIENETWWRRVPRAEDALAGWKSPIETFAGRQVKERTVRLAQRVPDFEGIGEAIRDDKTSGEGAKAGSVVAIATEEHFARYDHGVDETVVTNQEVEVGAFKLGGIGEMIEGMAWIENVAELEEGTGVVIDQCSRAVSPGPELLGCVLAEIEVREGPGREILAIEAGGFEKGAFGGGEIAGAFGSEAAIYERSTGAGTDLRVAKRVPAGCGGGAEECGGNGGTKPAGPNVVRHTN